MSRFNLGNIRSALYGHVLNPGFHECSRESAQILIGSGPISTLIGESIKSAPAAMQPHHRGYKSH